MRVCVCVCVRERERERKKEQRRMERDGPFKVVNHKSLS